MCGHGLACGFACSGICVAKVWAAFLETAGQMTCHQMTLTSLPVNHVVCAWPFCVI